MAVDDGDRFRFLINPQEQLRALFSPPSMPHPVDECSRAIGRGRVPLDIAGTWPVDSKIASAVKNGENSSRSLTQRQSYPFSLSDISNFPADS